jgi:hypothetical protein
LLVKRQKVCIQNRGLRRRKRGVLAVARGTHVWGSFWTTPIDLGRNSGFQGGEGEKVLERDASPQDLGRAKSGPRRHIRLD